MATLVKLRGLQRGVAAGSADVSPVARRGIRVKIANVPPPGGSGAVQATVLNGQTSAGRVRVTAKAAGAWGNNLVFATSSAGALAAAGAITTSGATLTYTIGINSGTTTGTALIAALAADPQFTALFQIPTASDAGFNAGAMTAHSTPLTTGADGTSTPLQPLLAVLSNNVTLSVDVDDLYNAKALRRDKGVNFISLGAA